MKKHLGDILYILLAVALVFGTLTLAFPNVGIDSALEPLSVVLPQPTMSDNHIAQIEGVAATLPEPPAGMTTLVLNWWDPDCKYCIEQLQELNRLAELRPDIAIIAFTESLDEDRIDAAIEELDLKFGVLYGYPNKILPTIPHTHVLVWVEGAWKLRADGSWMGVVEAETLLDYIAINERNDYQV